MTLLEMLQAGPQGHLSRDERKEKALHTLNLAFSIDVDDLIEMIETNGFNKDEVDSYFKARLEAIEEEVNDWVSREYKSSKKTVHVGGDEDSFNSRSYSVNYVNDRRRERVIGQLKALDSNLREIWRKL